MLPHERDFFIARIKSGYTRFNYNNNHYKFKLNKDLCYESEEIYYNTYIECLNNNIPSDNDIYNFLLQKNVWNEDEEERLRVSIPQYIENVKIEMYKSFHKKDDVERMRLYLNKAREELYKIYEIRHQYDYISSNGVALFAKWQFLIENCVTLSNNSNVDWETTQSHEILSLVNKSNISEETIRDVARNEPWGSIWVISKKCGDLFSGPVADYTEEQRRLISWSIMYDNVRESEDCPDLDIFDDDDCFDGWILLNNKNKKQEKDSDRINKKLGKNANAQELFIPVKSKNTPKDENREDASSIFSMNDQMANTIINSRINAIEQHGKLKVTELPDVKSYLTMEKNKIQMNGR